MSQIEGGYTLTIQRQNETNINIEFYIESFGLEELPRVSVNPYWTTVEVKAKVANA